MNIDYDKILKNIVDSKVKPTDSKSKNFLKTDTIGNVIIGRFLPYLKDLTHSDIPYFHHGWKSKLDNAGLFYLCPNSYGEKCPICTKSIQMWKSNDDILKKQSEGLRRRQNWMINFYVISDLKNPDNNGTVKIFKFGKQVRAKIDMAMEGQDKEIYGQRIWRLDAEGCSFRIMTEKNSSSKEGWPTYANSGFLPPTTISGMTNEKIGDILTNQVFDLTALFKKHTAAELIGEMQKHYFTNEIATIAQVSTPVATTGSTPLVNIPNMESAAPKQETRNESPSQSSITETELDKMLADLQGK